MQGMCLEVAWAWQMMESCIYSSMPADHAALCVGSADGRWRDTSRRIALRDPPTMVVKSTENVLLSTNKT
jgi:hypothetical protein